MSDGTVTFDDSKVRNRHVNASAGIARSKIAQRVLAVCAIPLTDLRTWDALATNLPGTPASDDLGLVTGTWGTDAPYIGTGDLKTTTTTRYAHFFAKLPPDYEAGETVNITLYAGMKTTVADTSAIVDLEVWRIDADGTLGASDICATAQQSINFLSADDYTFTITASTLTPGDVIAVRLKITVTDSATATAVIGAVYAIELQADLR